MTLTKGRAVACAGWIAASAVGASAQNIVPTFVVQDASTGSVAPASINPHRLSYTAGHSVPGAPWVSDSRFEGLVVAQLQRQFFECGGQSCYDCDGTGSGTDYCCVGNGDPCPRQFEEFGAPSSAERLGVHLQWMLLNGRAPAGPINITLQDLAHCVEFNEICLGDATDLTPFVLSDFPWANQLSGPLSTAERRSLHPWMTASRTRLSDYVTLFAMTYRDLAENGLIVNGVQHWSPWPGGTPEYAYLPPIGLLVVDAERGLEAAADVGYLRSVARDDRWDDPAYPIPGTNPPRTFAALWSEYASATWGDPTTTIADRPELAEPSYRGENRPVTIWYNQIAGYALDAFIKDAIFDPWQAVMGPESKTVAYRMFAADGLPHASGWHERNTQEPEWEFSPITEPTRFYHRYFLLASDQGSRRIEYPTIQPSLPGPTPLPTTWLWDRWARSSSADLDAPLCYPVVTHAFYNHRQTNYYLPGLPPETDWGASQRVMRDRVETAIGSFGGGRQHQLLPVMPAVGNGAQNGFGPGHDSLATADIVRSILSMLRAKDIRRAWAFRGAGDGISTNGYGSPSAAAWAEFKHVVQQAYAFQMTSVVEPNPPTMACLSQVPSAVETTLVDTSGADAAFETWFREIPDEPGKEASEVLVTFSTLEDHPMLGFGLELNIECEVDILIPPTDPGETYECERMSYDQETLLFGPFNLNARLEGEVYLWDFQAPQGGAWSKLMSSDTSNGSYAFSAPDASLRRSFRVLDATRFVSSSGEIRVRLRHKAVDNFTEHVQTEVGAIAFPVSRWGLVQVVRIPGQLGGSSTTNPPGEGCSECLAATPATAGADITLDGTVTVEDLGEFSAQFASGLPLADYNGDELITSDDALTFLEDFVEQVEE